MPDRRDRAFSGTTAGRHSVHQYSTPKIDHVPKPRDNGGRRFYAVFTACPPSRLAQPQHYMTCQGAWNSIWHMSHKRRRRRRAAGWQPPCCQFSVDGHRHMTPKPGRYGKPINSAVADPSPSVPTVLGHGRAAQFFVLRSRCHDTAAVPKLAAGAGRDARQRQCGKLAVATLVFAVLRFISFQQQHIA